MTSRKAQELDELRNIYIAMINYRTRVKECFDDKMDAIDSKILALEEEKLKLEYEFATADEVIAEYQEKLAKVNGWLRHKDKVEKYLRLVRSIKETEEYIKDHSR